MVNLYGNSMKLEDIRFPLYVVHSDEVMRRDGVLWIDGAVIDDTNVEGGAGRGGGARAPDRRSSRACSESTRECASGTRAEAPPPSPSRTPSCRSSPRAD